MNYSGKWALITGASAGIGETFAKALAAKGANLILVARRQDRLEKLAADLSAKYSVQAIAIAADLSAIDSAVDVIEKVRVKSLHVDILINNAGYGLPGTFDQNDWPEHRGFLELMVRGTRISRIWFCLVCRSVVGDGSFMLRHLLVLCPVQRVIQCMVRLKGFW